jgi:hypothetical protein
MAPRDWLLLLIALCPLSEGLDPVRIQKGAFLLAQEGGLRCDEAYSFAPYNYGPMSREVYRDLDRLVQEGLIERSEVAGYSWRRHKATPDGRTRARGLLASTEAEPSAISELRRIEGHIAARGFVALLSDVYERYPSYAARSVFRRVGSDSVAGGDA